MLRVIDRFLGSGSRWRALAPSLACVVVIGLLDHYTGSEIAFSIFYLIPVSLVSWYCGRYAGFAVCVLCAASWLAVDVTTQSYSASWIPVWNAAARLVFFCLTSYLLTDLRTRLDREHEQARTDVLTGISNARAFAEEAQLVLALAARSRRPAALAYVDVDNFKALNDTLGHAEGDRVLAALCATMRQSLRATDLIGRLGGDEFAVLLPETDMAGAHEVFDALHRRLTGETQTAGWPIGLSIGVAVFDPPPPAIAEAIKRADALMYRVKRGGKGGVAFERISAPGAGPQTPAASQPRRAAR